MEPKEKDAVVAYYDEIAGTYDESRFGNSYGHFIDAEERRILDQLLPPNPLERRLEIACGTGRLTNYATHGLDASAEMLARAREMLEEGCREPGLAEIEMMKGTMQCGGRLRVLLLPL